MIIATMFFDPARITATDDRFDYGEERLVTLGRTDDGVLIVVATERDHDRTIRIISARKASRRERSRY